MADNELDFLEGKSTSNPGRVKDILVFVLHNLHWFILCAAIGGGIAYYVARGQARSYASSAKIMLKMSNVNRGGASNESAIMNGIAQNYFYTPFTTTINNEIMIITSKTNMMEVVRRLNLGTDYTRVSRLAKRTENLYGESPVDVKFLDLGENEYLSFQLTFKPDSLFVVEGAGCSALEGRLGSEVALPSGRIVVTPTWFYNPGFYGETITVNHRSAEDVADQYRYSVAVSHDDPTNTILNLSLRDLSPSRAADVLNTLIDVYNEDSVEDKTKIIENTYEFINQRIAQLDKDLGAKEGQLASFKRANQIIDVDALGQQSMARKALHSEEAERLNRQLSLARYTQGMLVNASDSSPLMVAFDDATIASEVARYNETAIKLSKYTSAGSSQNPMVTSLSNEIAIIRSNIASMLATYIETLEGRLSEARSAESKAVAEINAVPEKQIYVSDIERLQEVKSALYLNLLGKREELLISQPSIEAAARVIDRARVNRSPVSPDSRRMILIGILLGLLLPTGLMFLLRLFDTSVRYRGDIEDSTTVPFVGEVPARKKGDDREIVVEAKKRDMISEAFRLLRSNVSFLRNPDANCTVFMTTSMLEGSGKTFIAANLAASFAIAGKKVVIVDADIRKGTITKNFQLGHDRQGLSEWLSGGVDDLASLVCEDVMVPGIDFVPSGHMPPNPAELLMSDRLEVLVDWLRSRYDYVFIDAVPSNVVADSDIVKRVVDATLFIIRSGKLDKRDLPGLQYMYESHKYPNMGVVLNDLKIKKRGRYGYGYGYGYGTGYGYGYGYGYGSTKGYGYGYGYGDEEKENK